MNKNSNQTKPPRKNGGNNNKNGNNSNSRNNNNKNSNNKNNGQKKVGGSRGRGAAIRAQRRAHDDAQKTVNRYLEQPDMNLLKGDKNRANNIDESPRLKVVGLGGLDGGGSKNMILVEYRDDAIVMDCGNDLSVDLPGINYGIADVSYLKSIKHKLRAYVITHGHLDHIGGLPHIVPELPAPIYGSRFTIGMVEKVFENFGIAMPEGFELNTVVMNEDTHERLKVGPFFVELVRITHSIPGSTCIVLDTPVGRLINTGDFRLDPNPLDHEKTDTERLIELGKEGVLMLMSDSTTSERPGRTPSESTIEPTYVDLFERAPGRVFIGVFSSNMNRIQMIVNAAVAHGRKVAFDGRSMVGTLELAVRLGMMKIPKGQVVPIGSVSQLKDEEVVVVCTGSQGEPNSALQRMSEGEHRHVKLKEQDTVILSSTPIPESGNDKLIGMMVDDLMKKQVHVYRHVSRDVDGCGPLHVSGHASQEEFADMIRMTQPKFFMPIYGPYRAKKYHVDIAINEGIPRDKCFNIDNGEILELTEDSAKVTGKVPVGTTLVDQTGATVSGVVIKDRLMLAEEGLVSVVLTIDKKSGQLLTSPDIISRGFIYMKDSEDLMNSLRTELRRAVGQRYKRIDLDRFKAELKDHITHFLYEQTGGSPIVIPVVNIVSGKSGGGNGGNGNGKSSKNNGGNTKKKEEPKPTPEQIAEEQQKRFQEMRARLLGQDPRTD